MIVVAGGCEPRITAVVVVFLDPVNVSIYAEHDSLHVGTTARESLLSSKFSCRLVP
jgi:hypothetical protein